MENQEKFWLFIKPHVYVSRVQNKRLLYNTQNGEHIETGDSSAIQIIEELHEKKNLGTILLEQKNINSELKTFIRATERKDILGTIAHTKDCSRPIQLMPVLNIQRSIEKSKKRKERSVGEDALQYLTELTLFVNNTCGLRCEHCKSAYKQVQFCTRNNEPTSLDLATLQSIAKQIQYAPVVKLNILGGNIFQYPLLKNVLEVFNNRKGALHLGIHYRNFQVNNWDVNLDIWVDFPLDENIFSLCASNVQRDKTSFHFLVENEKDVEFAGQIIEKHNLSNADLQPLFNGNNLDFFEQNVFLNREDIFTEPVPQRKIFCNQALNSHNFGKLNVLPNGDVLANINTPKLGNIKEKTLMELLYKELDENTAWRRTRTGKPCNDCLYQYLCPSPSNYEFVIGRENLCLVKS